MKNAGKLIGLVVEGLRVLVVADGVGWPFPSCVSRLGLLHHVVGFESLGIDFHALGQDFFVRVVCASSSSIASREAILALTGPESATTAQHRHRRTNSSQQIL